MARPELTWKQQRIFNYLKQEIRNRGQAPSLRTAAADLNISHAAVAQAMGILERKQYIRRHGRYSRVIRIIDPAGQTDMTHYLTQVPVIGQITVGQPIYAAQEQAGTVLVDSRLYPGKYLFAIRVQGNSMKNAGILDQDLAICTPRQYAHNREIVVALVHQEKATIKRFFLHSDFIELRPENPDFKSRTYAFDQILIQGKVTGILRSEVWPDSWKS